MDIHAVGKYKRMILELKLSLIGEGGLDNIKDLLEKVKEDNIRGAFVEAGVWRGGACIYARACMDYLGIKEPVIACDSFKGLPEPSWKEDEGDQHYLLKELAVSEHTVRENIGYFVLEGNIELVSGFFEETMPMLKDKLGDISILRIDGDLYQSTTEVLENLYDKVSVGGFVIVDDYALDGARMAIDEFREKYNIKNSLIKVNGTIYYWQK